MPRGEKSDKQTKLLAPRLLSLAPRPAPPLSSSFRPSAHRNAQGRRTPPPLLPTLTGGQRRHLAALPLRPSCALATKRQLSPVALLCDRLAAPLQPVALQPPSFLPLRHATPPQPRWPLESSCRCDIDIDTVSRALGWQRRRASGNGESHTAATGCQSVSTARSALTVSQHRARAH